MIIDFSYSYQTFVDNGSRLNSKYSSPFLTISVSTIPRLMSLSLNLYFFARQSCVVLIQLSQSLDAELKPNFKKIWYGGGGISMFLGKMNMRARSYLVYSGVLNLLPLHASLTDKGLIFTLCISVQFFKSSKQTDIALG